MPGNNNDGISYAYKTWYAYLELRLLQSDIVSCYNSVEYNIASQL